ncbi:hypothetical protein HID58_062310 [Brassica napus]|uniref:Defensin-like protein n=1 Tax=Brassica napus TaxID=3708 RepID=A0ABQ8A122_BRANA|nr:hypothetical protein HID58_062310 [Brassica napus]
MGMVAKETQGEKRCHINISYGNEDCESMACNFDCASKWKGLGECVSTESPNCICAYRMVAKETQGENMCHINISYGNEGCESMVCSFDCASNWKGFGECVSTESPNCICAYPCAN